jgi:hypothetical protein
MASIGNTETLLLRKVNQLLEFDTFRGKKIGRELEEIKQQLTNSPYISDTSFNLHRERINVFEKSMPNEKDIRGFLADLQDDLLINV